MTEMGLKPKAEARGVKVDAGARVVITPMELCCRLSDAGVSPQHGALLLAVVQLSMAGVPVTVSAMAETVGWSESRVRCQVRGMGFSRDNRLLVTVGSVQMVDKRKHRVTYGLTKLGRDVLAMMSGSLPRADQPMRGRGRGGRPSLAEKATENLKG